MLRCTVLRLRLRLSIAVVSVLSVAACGQSDGSASGAEVSSDEGAPTDLELGMAGDLGPPATCTELNVGFETVTPTVVVLVDESSSMFDTAYGAFDNRWDPLRSVFLDPQTGLIPALDNDVRFGFAAYTADQAEDVCPRLSEVPAQFGNYESIVAVWLEAVDMRAAAGGKGETPTGSAVRSVTQSLEALAATGPKFIILATDGEPDTCALADPQCGQDESIAALQEARAGGIGTFVVGIGDQVAQEHLADLANAGAGLPVVQREPSGDCVSYATNEAVYSDSSVDERGVQADFYQPEDETELQAAFERIIGGVRSCTFELTARVDPALAHLGSVNLDDEALVYQGSDGWRLISPTQIEILGTACDRITNDESGKLAIAFPCQAAVPR